MKTLVAYFSASGQTAKLAKILAGVTGGDLFEIAPETAYTAADLDWMDKKSYKKLDDFRGKLSRKNLKDPYVYQRAQYVDILAKSEEIFKKHPMV